MREQGERLTECTGQLHNEAKMPEFSHVVHLRLRPMPATKVDCASQSFSPVRPTQGIPAHTPSFGPFTHPLWVWPAQHQEPAVSEVGRVQLSAGLVNGEQACGAAALQALGHNVARAGLQHCG